MRTRSYQNRPTARSKLGRGARTVHRYRKFQPYRGQRQFVPRTMGPFSVSESKYFDSFRSAVAVPESTDWTGTEIDPATLDTLFVPQEGSDINNRIGRKVCVYKIAIRGVQIRTASADQADILSNTATRLILFLDTQTNSTQAQGEQLMESPGAATTPLVFSTFQNLANLGRFRVLRDITLDARVMTAGTDGASTTSQNSAQIPFKIVVRFKRPIDIKFNATNGGSIGDIVDNSFHLLAQKSSGNGDHTISYQCRTYYKDK